PAAASKRSPRINYSASRWLHAALRAFVNGNGVNDRRRHSRFGNQPNGPKWGKYVNDPVVLILYGLALLGAGLACGIINTLASSGSAVSLPVLMMLGLSPLDANATNRLSVLSGSLMALYTFHANKEVNWRAGLEMAIPATLGS